MYIFSSVSDAFTNPKTVAEKKHIYILKQIDYIETFRARRQQKTYIFRLDRSIYIGGTYLSTLEVLFLGKKK